MLALVERILSERPRLSILMTTSTSAAARLVKTRLPDRVYHQFVPMDLPSSTERFLNHWRPNLGLWVQSALWPNLIRATHRHDIPILWGNARIMLRSLITSRVKIRLLRPVLRTFGLCLAYDAVSGERLRKLGASRVTVVGDLKAAAPPLAADPTALARLRRQIGKRPVWLAASTHKGEEEIVAAAHAVIVREHRDLLTIVAPRQPARGPSISDMFRGRDLNVARRKAREPITESTDVYIADTLAELGLFFRVASVAFIGGSLVRRGGHNPIEAARLNCAVLYGPDMSKNFLIASALNAASAALTVDAQGLGVAVSRLLADPTERQMRATAGEKISSLNDCLLSTVLVELAPWLDDLESSFKSITLRHAQWVQPREQKSKIYFSG